MDRLRFTRRRLVVAVAATTVACGSAAAFALTLPEPLQAPVGKIAKGADNVVEHVISHKDPDDPPSDPKFSVPGSEQLPLPGILGTQSAAAPPRAPKPKATRKPAPGGAAPADPVTEVAQTLLGPDTAPAPEPAPAPTQEAEPGELEGVFEEPLVSIGNRSYGDGWNFCNNNNSETIVNRDSDGTRNDVDQQQRSGDMVTNVDGRDYPADPSDNECS